MKELEAGPDHPKWMDDLLVQFNEFVRMFKNTYPSLSYVDILKEISSYLTVDEEAGIQLGKILDVLDKQYK